MCSLEEFDETFIQFEKLYQDFLRILQLGIDLETSDEELVSIHLVLFQIILNQLLPGFEIIQRIHPAN